MSEKRREKRAADRADKKGFKKVVKIGLAKITLTEKRVEIAYPTKKTIYNAGTREYTNYVLLFDGENEQENKAYGEVLIGLEMIPSFGHSDATLVEKLMSVIIDDFTIKLNAASVTEEQDDLQREAESLLDLQISDVLNGNKE